MPPPGFRNPFERTSPPPGIVVVIPARFDATRLPGKPLADIAGRPMIEHVYRRASGARGVDAVIVATDDQRIAAAVERFGGIARMTRSSHRTGTDRVAEVALELDCEIIVNVQGDLPLIEPGMIEEAVAPFAADPSVNMTTLRRAISDAAEHANLNVVKVVCDLAGDALYFSRATVPHFRGGPAAGGHPGRADVVSGFSRTVYKHVGLYAYRRAFLLTFAGLPQTPLEIAESLEQLRALEHGIRIRTVETHFESIEVDTPEDLERVRRLIPPHRAGGRGGDSGNDVAARA